MRRVDTAAASPYFRIEQLADGVYAALVREGSGALGNAGIIDLGDETVVFDTMLTPGAARDLRESAEYLTKHRVRYVVNSHWHRDHVYGNQVFTDADIIADSKTREVLSGWGMAVLENARRQMSDVIREMKAALECEPHEQRRGQMSRELNDELAFQAALPDLVLTLPTVTFDKELILHGSRRTVAVVCAGPAHTEADTYLLLPDEGIAFVGDLVMVRNHPWLGHGNPALWLKVLYHLETLNLQHIVSGHGPSGTSTDIRLVQEYIHEVLALVQRRVETGASLAQTEATALPERWADWGLREVFGWNMAALYDSLTKSSHR